MRTLVWLRADLRTHDNPALHHAARDSGGEVIAVFIISPEQWRSHDWSGIRIRFLLDHLRELSASLARLNIPLIIASTPRFDGQPALLLGLARQHHCEAIYLNDEYELNESRRDAAVIELFAKHGLTARAFTDQCVMTPGQVRTGEGRFFTVFSPFKRALYARLQERGPDHLTPLAAPRKQPPTGIAPSPVPESVKGYSTTVPADLWPAGEAVALKRLRTFIDKHLARYRAERDFPALDSTSVLSPYLAVGSITHRQCLHAALAANGGSYDKDRGGGEGAVHWISEIAWREFYRHILVGFPRICMHRAFKPATERIRWSDNDEHFQAWCDGRTGVPIVDAGMRQLAATGWMHNRIRMIAAMYLTKDLFIDWRRGEAHFMRSLIDGDLASNNGGWQWSASTGTDAAPYFRIFNPITQSRKFDPDGEYIRRWVPELAGLDGDGGDGPIHDPSDLPALLRPTLDYPAPIVDRAKVRERVMHAFQSLQS